MYRRALDARARGHRHDARPRRGLRRDAGERDEQLQLAQAGPRAHAAGQGRARVRRAHRPRASRARTRPTRARPRSSSPSATTPGGRPRPAHARRPDGRPRSSRTASRAASTRSSSSRSPTRAAAEAREYAFGFEADTRGRRSSAARASTAPTARSTRRSRAARGRPTTPRIAHVHERARLLRPLPSAPPGRRGRAPLPRRGRRPAQRLRRLLRRGELRCSRASRSARAEYVLITPKSRTFYFNKPHRAGPQADDDETGDSRIFHFVARTCRRSLPEPLQPPYERAPRPRARLDLPSRGTTWARWYWGLVKDQFVADDEVRRRVAEVDQRAQDRAREGPRDLRLRRHQDALRGARVRHPRLQAVPVRADLRARVRRLQRQGDAHRHDAQGARASRRPS